MGYEIRLHIGQEWSHNTEDFDRKYGRSVEELTMVKLSKPGYDSHIFKLMQERQERQVAVIEATGIKYVLYGDGQDAEGNEQRTTEDRYGKPLAPIPFREAYQALLRDYADSMGPTEYGNGYRRFAVAVSMFESVLTRFPEGEGEHARPLVVLGYGY